MAEQAAADLLVELGCEELPPKALPELAKAFFDGVCAGLEQAQVAFEPDRSTYWYTPRRMAVRLAAVAGAQPDRVQDRRGPAVAAAFDAEGQPTPAATGFARSVGREVSELETLSNDKGEWLFCRVEVQGSPLTELIYPVLQDALDRLPAPGC